MTVICFEVVIHDMMYLVKSSLLLFIIVFFVIQCSLSIRFLEEILLKSAVLSSWKANSSQHVNIEKALKPEIKIIMAL